MFGTLISSLLVKGYGDTIAYSIGKHLKEC